MESQFEILEHPSDMGIEAHGSSIKEMFRNAARGLTFIIAGESKISCSAERSVSIQAMDLENLMVRWLTEMVFLFDTDKYLTADVNILDLGDTFLKAKLFGEPFDENRHELKIDVKAITYHQLKIEKKDGIWRARIIVDI